MSSNALEWLNKNMHSNYPIVDDCVVKSTTGEYVPSSLLADLSLVVSPLGDEASYNRFFISSIERAGSAIRVAISYKPAQGVPFVCAITPSIPISLRAGDTVADRTFPLVAAAGISLEYSQLRNLTGLLIIGSCVDIQTAGSYYLEYENATILSTRILQIPSGLYSVSVLGSNDEEQAVFTSDFTIRAGDGIHLSVMDKPPSEEGLEASQVLVIRREETAAETAAELKTVSDVIAKIRELLGRPITSISGVSPDSTGNINLIGEDCTEITGTTAGVIISNPCSKPCCGEAGLSEATTSLQALEEAKNRLVAYFEALSNNINSMQSRLSSLIASRR